ncbi:MAG: RIP metalloprotease RseP [Lachnospiraceae bacterium]|jgi:regulator of sigma E protease|nr:RIP metalloprotease RseP [Lachnospiraceae bacterium]
MIFSILLAVLVFSLLVVSHEFGHFLLAKKNGIGVIEFSVGMGPRILSGVRGDTRYSLKAIPFGGSCQMVGEDDEDDSENSFNSKSPFARFAVVIGGPLFNFLLALILSVVVLSLAGVNEPRVYYVSEGYGAERAGLKEGDLIRSIDGHKMTLGRDIELYFLSHPMDGSPITIEYERDGEIRETILDPSYEAYLTGFSYYASEDEAIITALNEELAMAKAGAKMGDVITAIDGTPIASGAELQAYFEEYPLADTPVNFTLERNGKAFEISVTPTYYTASTLGMEAVAYRNKEAGAASVLRNSISEVRYWMSYTLTSLKMLVTGKVGVENLSGPVGIVNMVGEVVEQSKSDGTLYVFLNILNFSILLSVNLGVLNLLPLPALDGGRLVFILIELIRGKPVSREKEGMVHTIGLLLLMALMVFVMFNDVLRIFR